MCKLRYNIFTVFILLVLIASGLYGQTVVGEWKNYTSSLGMQDVVQYEDELYIATSGGLLIFAENNQKFNIFKDDAGLSSLDIQTAKFDDNQILWLGMAEGELNFFDATQKQVLQNYIVNYDLANFRENLSNITVINGNGNDCFVACQKQMQWGLLHFIKKSGQYYYKDYYFQYPENLAGINDLIIHNNNIFIATGEGLIRGDFVNTNLKSPDVWNFINDTDELNITSIIKLDNQVYFAGNSALYRLENNGIIKVDNDLNGNINKIYTIDQNNIRILTDNGVHDYDLLNEQLQQVVSEKAIDIISGQAPHLYGITGETGLWHFDGEKAQYYLPNTLISNKYSSIYVDGDRIAAASDRGISFSTEKGWYNIVRTGDYEQPFKGLTINNVDPDYFSAGSLAYHITGNGKIWSLVKRQNKYYATLHRSTIKNNNKGGLLSFDPLDPQNYTVYDTTDNIITASAGVGEGSAHYLVPAAMKKDPQGNLWIISQYAQNGNVLTVLTPEDEWHHFSIADSDGLLNHFLNDLTFGPDNKVWIASTTFNTAPISNGGIFMLDYNGTLEDKSDDSWKRFDQTDGLESNNAFSLDFDQTGILWIMTIAGIQKAEVIDNDLNFLYFSNGKYNLFSNLSFANFCRIKSDRDNNVWFSTEDEGMKIYSKTGEWWPLGQLNDSLDFSEGFTKENSDILSNTVLDFDFNEEDGKVYFATDNGISVLKYRYPVMQKEYKNLTAFPSPFIIPKHTKLVIDGLLENSSVKIMTLTGKVVRTIDENSEIIKGRQLHWDGRNDDGNYIGSGVYIVMAYNNEGKSKAGKIAVVRQ